VYPGQLVDVEVFDASSQGIFVRFLDDFIGTIHISDLDLPSPIDVKETYKPEMRVRKFRGNF
jgi:predicted RNA-binding protein with RPS1 domain